MLCIKPTLRLLLMCWSLFYISNILMFGFGPERLHLQAERPTGVDVKEGQPTATKHNLSGSKQCSKGFHTIMSFNLRLTYTAASPHLQLSYFCVTVKDNSVCVCVQSWHQDDTRRSKVKAQNCPCNYQCSRFLITRLRAHGGGCAGY